MRHRVSGFCGVGESVRRKADCDDGVACGDCLSWAGGSFTDPR